MSEFLGSRISLISKSDIRYVGVLHEINSEESTVSLENVKSFGTEGRRGKPEEEIAPSDQVYEYIVFRGSDVKDLRIEQAPATKENQPPAVPDDPAIVGARPRPGGAPPNGPPGIHPAGLSGGPPNNHAPPPFAGNPYYGNWPRQGGPMGPGGPGGPGGPPGPGFNGLPYPPPPGWFPPGQGYPHPPGPGPWNAYGFPPHGGPPPPGPSPGGRPPQGAPQQQQDQKPPPIGARVDKGKAPASDGSAAPAELEQPAQPQAANFPPPTPPVDSKPSAEEVKATAASLAQAGATSNRSIPTGPKVTRITPAIPLPTALTQKTNAQASIAVTGVAVNDLPNNAANTQAALRDATQAARAAVAVAMAKLEGGGNAAAAPAQQSNGNPMDNLTKKVNEMRVNAGRGNGGNRGGRGRGPRPTKVEVPDSDFDFATSNAKFNKSDLVKEAVSGSPQGEAPNKSLNEIVEKPDDGTVAPPAYNKASSFFDNISSEARDRAENGGQKPGGREWRGEEQRKNMETFGQGSVDGGYRQGGYRGRGRGRGGMRNRGGGRGRGYRRGGDGQASAQQ
ncbi:hypothetical protein GGTG_10783 [Gaeumannomyces tritici R3-111a-1]|uniref:G2/M phase checkpoint control protein Sum2 n=1 Tax=Gaeumannomyces tritici (strain R3-111a-1) TaxID=644352 RepID=J3PBB0_GAET3|nr:hypothetical protein GGTG_10783 [Gaeumannomyces tritici R3-111a-1]EJT71526.1 hypothetical protein GGTG_10783 [Gaeumannomyces tritici R3-111a-1]